MTTAHLRLVQSGGDEPSAWSRVVDEFETALRAAGRSAGTIRLRRIQLANLARQCPDPWAVSGDDLVTWLAEPSWSPETRKSCRAGVRTFYAWAARTGRMAGDSPAEQLEPITVPRALPRPISEDALDRALATATDRERLMIVFGAFAGLRAHEIAKVHPRRDVSVDGLLSVTGKGGRQRLVPLHPVIVAELAAELGRRAAGGCGTGWRYHGFVTLSGYLFPGTRAGRPETTENVSRTLSRLLGEDWTAHTLRHRFASAAYAVERDLRAVQELLGHSKPETTARYTLVPDGALRAAVLGIGGHS